MNGHLLDTNVLSEFTKPFPNSDVLKWVTNEDPDSLFASVITYGELRFGVEKMPVGKRRSELGDWLEVSLRGWFSSDLLPVTKEIVQHWARLSAESRRRGITLGTPDGLIAATALHHGLTLVTRNIKDFANLGLDLFNPWEPKS